MTNGVHVVLKAARSASEPESNERMLVLEIYPLPSECMMDLGAFLRDSAFAFMNEHQIASGEIVIVRPMSRP